MREERATIQVSQVLSTVRIDCPANQIEYMKQFARILLDIFTHMPPEDRNPYEASASAECC
jgi:hypothetical protein